MKLRSGLVALAMFFGWEAPPLRAVEEPPAEELYDPEEIPPARRLAFSLSTTVPTEYVAQGLACETDGWIVQPLARVSLSLFDGVDVFFGFFGSFHDEHTDAGATNPPDAPRKLRAGYEADWFAGATLSHGRWSLTSFYAGIYSPSDAYESASSVDVILAFADHGLLAEKLSLEPYANFFVETNDKSGTGIREGYYMQFGAKPSHPIDVLGHEVLVTMPVATGIGWSDFYAENELFGFVSAGLAPIVPLAPWIPSEYGSWSITPAVQYFHLNEDVQVLPIDGDRVVASATLTLEF